MTFKPAEKFMVFLKRHGHAIACERCGCARFYQVSHTAYQCASCGKRLYKPTAARPVAMAGRG